jgi:uncharacterized protein
MPRGMTSLGAAQRATLGLLRLAGLGPAAKRTLLDYRVTEVSVSGVAADCSVLHLSDLHLEGIPDGCESLCEVLRSVPSDVCVITGDFVDPAIGDLEEMQRRLSLVAASVSAPLGLLAVLGDHDPPETADVLQAVGVALLGVAEVVPPSSESVALRFVGARRSAQYIAAPATGALVFVAHSPDSRTEALSIGADYFLCGHTHGGQVCAPGGWPILTRTTSSRRFARGAWEYGGMRGYTSRGIGVCGGFPRINCRPEVVLHRLSSRRDVQS